MTCTVWPVADTPTDDLAATLDHVIAEIAFSGVVRVDRPGQPPFELAAGYADRRWSIPMTPAMRLSTASATKGFTALTVMGVLQNSGV